jgi:hypothetical protein
LKTRRACLAQICIKATGQRREQKKKKQPKSDRAEKQPKRRKKRKNKNKKNLRGGGLSLRRAEGKRFDATTCKKI